MDKLLIAVITVFTLLLFLCLLIRRTRELFSLYVKTAFNELWNIAVDEKPVKGQKTSIWFYIFTLLLVIPVAILFAVVLLLIGPIICIIHSLKNPSKIDDIIKLEKDLRTPKTALPKKSPEEIVAEKKAYWEKYLDTHFEVPIDNVTFVLDVFEVFFYTPSPNQYLEKQIEDNLDQIKETFKAKGLHFFFLPEYNRCFNELETVERLDYFNPRNREQVEIPVEVLTYNDIQETLSIPERVDAPCFIRYNSTSSGSHWFSYWKFENDDTNSILEIVKEYLSKAGDYRLFNIPSDEELKTILEGLLADDRFYDDVRQIGKEISERVDKLRSLGLSSLAIRKLIGDDSDKPGKLLIDRHNRLILTDYGNKEIKLSPLHKAVFFLFLRHPEGIYFKDLGSYREELKSIYEEITGRDDLSAIEDSIDKLTDPFDNSINEKCARIKNAFVSEFREEVAQWYFIDGKKGEKKGIKLPRELVTWEIKD